MVQPANYFLTWRASNCRVQCITIQPITVYKMISFRHAIYFFNPFLSHLFISVFTVIELSCGEYGEDKIPLLLSGSENGKNLRWFENPNTLIDAADLRGI